MKNKNILITGASDGIGQAMALELASKGCHLALMARRKEKLDELANQITREYPGQRVMTYAVDVCDAAQLTQAIDCAASDLDILDVVVVNAGIARAGKLGQVDTQSQLDVLNTNLMGALTTINAAVNVFKKQGFGHIVGISSVAAFRGLPRNAAYSASKAGISTLLEGLRAESAKDNIDVTILYPGFIDTEINRSMPSRPFVIPVEKGAQLCVQHIERRSKRAFVPAMPWRVIGPLFSVLPNFVVSRM